MRVSAFFASVRAPRRKIPLRAACARTVLLAAAGLLTGVVIQFLDRDSPVLGDVFSQMSVWIFLCTALSVGSGTPLRAGVNVFAFLLPMVVAYYATAEALQRPYSTTFVTGWAVCACLSPLFGFSPGMRGGRALSLSFCAWGSSQGFRCARSCCSTPSESRISFSPC